MHTLITEKWLPQNARNTRNLLAEKHLPQNPRNAQNLLAEKWLPQNARNTRNLLAEKHLPQNPRNAQNLLAEKHLPQMRTDAHRLGGYGILPYPRCLRNPVVSARLYRLSEQELHQQNKQGYRPQNAQNTQNLLAEKHLPQNPRNAQNLLAEKHLPQIGTDAHRLGGYGILPYPRSQQNPVVSARLYRLSEQELHQQNKQG